MKTTSKQTDTEAILREIGQVKTELQQLKQAAAIELITIDEVAGLLKFSRKHIHELCKTGKFPPKIKIGTSTRFRAADIANWINQQQQSA